VRQKWDPFSPDGLSATEFQSADAALAPSGATFRRKIDDVTQVAGVKAAAGKHIQVGRTLILLELAERGRHAGAPRGIKDVYARMAMSVLL
jgi:hypothetical protein